MGTWAPARGLLETLTATLFNQEKPSSPEWAYSSQSHVPPFSSMFPSLGLCPSYWILRLSCRLAIIKLSAKDQWDSKPRFSQHVMSKYG